MGFCSGQVFLALLPPCRFSSDANFALFCLCVFLPSFFCHFDRLVVFNDRFSIFFAGFSSFGSRLSSRFSFHFVYATLNLVHK